MLAEGDWLDKHSKPSKLKFVKMLVMDDLTALTIAAVVASGVDAEATVKTDAYAGNNSIKKKAYRHMQQVIDGADFTPVVEERGFLNSNILYPFKDSF